MVRKFETVSGTLLILSIIDFALAAPVPVQEKHQARANMVHTPKDVITMSEKWGFEDLEKGQTSAVIQNTWQPMDDDGLRNTLEGDWLAEDGATEDVADLVTRERAT